MGDSPRIAWITGAGGLIGSYVVRTAAAFGQAWVPRGLTRAELDLTSSGAVRRAFRRDDPGLVIHCAALSRSPACAADPALAHRVNVEVTRELVELAAEIPLVFFSTDLVFDGRAGNYDETAAVNPLSVYAETKVKAEKVVSAHPRAYIIRTSLNGGISPTGDRGFNEELRRAWQAGRPVRLFTDEFRSPIFAGLTARAVWGLVTGAPPGIYHVAGGERLSRWDIGQALAVRWPQFNARCVPGSLRDYQGQPRPPDTSLCCAKARGYLGFPLPGLKAWLAAHPEEPF